MRVATIVLALAAAATAATPSTKAFSIAYYTTIRNDTDRAIELDPDLMDSRRIYRIASHTALTFLGGFSTVGFSIRTGDRTFYYKCPLWFGAESTLHKGRQNHSYAFLPDHRIYPLSAGGTILRESHDGFPIAALPTRPNCQFSTRCSQKWVI